MTPKPLRAAQLFVLRASPGPSWHLKRCREDEYILFMDPFGSDTKRYDMHYTCHSTSICHFWHPFLHFPPIFFHYFDNDCCQSDSKATLIYLKWFQSDPKVYQMAPKWCQMTPKPPRIAQSFVRLVSSRPSWHLKICRENEYILFMDPFGSDTKRYDMHYMCHSIALGVHFSLSGNCFPLFLWKLPSKRCQVDPIDA